MQFHKQLFRHDPNNGIYGDCHRTALACLLDKKPEEVPHFGEHYMDNTASNKGVHDYLSTLGLSVFVIPFMGNPPIEQALKCMATWNPNTYYMLGGTSPRGTNHTVICLNNEIIHDPHPDGGGLIGACDLGTDNEAYWVDIIIPISMKAK